MKNAWLFVALILLAGCTRGLDLKLDGSSEQKFAASLAKMRESATPDDVKRLDEALRVLAVSDVSIGFEGGILGALAKLEAKSPESLAEFLLPQVNGRTGRDVVTAGAEVGKAGKTVALLVQREDNRIFIPVTLG